MDKYMYIRIRDFNKIIYNEKYSYFYNDNKRLILKGEKYEKIVYHIMKLLLYPNRIIDIYTYYLGLNYLENKVKIDIFLEIINDLYKALIIEYVSDEDLYDCSRIRLNQIFSWGKDYKLDTNDKIIITFIDSTYDDCFYKFKNYLDNENINTRLFLTKSKINSSKLLLKQVNNAKIDSMDNLVTFLENKRNDPQMIVLMQNEFCNDITEKVVKCYNKNCQIVLNCFISARGFIVGPMLSSKTIKSVKDVLLIEDIRKDVAKLEANKYSLVKDLRNKSIFAGIIDGEIESYIFYTLGYGISFKTIDNLIIYNNDILSIRNKQIIKK